MGESIAEGTMSRWLKKVGDEVKRDEPIFEISTDKVDAEIPSPAAGVLAEVSVTEGQTVAVGTVVARLETDKAAFAAGGAPAPAAAPHGAAAAPPRPPPNARTRRLLRAPGAVARRRAERRGSAADAIQTAAAGNSFEERVRTKSSPLVRKMAAEHGIEIAGMQGSGIAGRVTKRDLEAALAGGGAPLAGAAASAAAPVPTQPAIAAAAVQGGPEPRHRRATASAARSTATSRRPRSSAWRATWSSP
jgi:2-oxoglutarate dehydrogenase E2 component (dihydrolipoamide succinyltransferase)